ncbi:unnamed protein product [Hyaloperonospora brassicae]|uniref:Uncharacterized protein n=1 Tax=Hyaloperonospora brassicae TaxID=162125 RepID=A0AAV0TLR3_HYABA|nr:unnamed protein product [Hyaloperonospora brassicae]
MRGDGEDDGEEADTKASARTAARASSTERHNRREVQPETSPSKCVKERVRGVSMSKAAAAWETIESIGNAPTERWGHTATKISNDRVVAYGGIDDEERTLGDLHVFDMQTHRWKTPINCETIPRTWHDAVHLPLKNVVLVFGGERTESGDGELAVLSDVMVLDTECFLWFPPAIRGPPPSARSGYTCTAIGNETVVLVEEQDGIGGARHTFWTLVSKK